MQLTDGVVDALVIPNLEWLERTARRLCRRLPRRIQWQDVRQAGYLALAERAEKFDPDRGVAFRHFAARRVRGAMVDFVRGDDRAFRRLRAGAPRLGALAGDVEIVDPRGEQPLRRVEEREQLKALIAALPRAQRFVVLLKYQEDMTDAEIAATLDLSESRVCQLRNKTMTTLRRQMRAGRRERSE